MMQDALVEHLQWLRSTAMMDLDDPALRLRVKALTQLKTSRRLQVLAVYAFVKRLPLCVRAKRRERTATEVLRAGRGDAADKATLLVAMLRLLGVPARMRFVSLRAPILRGLGAPQLHPARPVVEIWTGEGWVGTDTYIFDPAYMAAARQRLREAGTAYGWGIHVHGAMVWDARTPAYVSGCAPEQDPMVARDHGLHDDPQAFLQALARVGGVRWRWRLVRWNLFAHAVQRRVVRVREGRLRCGGADTRAPGRRAAGSLPHERAS